MVVSFTDDDGQKDLRQRIAELEGRLRKTSIVPVVAASARQLVESGINTFSYEMILLNKTLAHHILLIVPNHWQTECISKLDTETRTEEAEFRSKLRMSYDRVGVQLWLAKLYKQADIDSIEAKLQEAIAAYSSVVEEVQKAVEVNAGPYDSSQVWPPAQGVVASSTLSTMLTCNNGTDR
ncbi:TPA: hypothetical protein ACH3X2_012941 [Trebouxia sp. C0005]